MNKNRNQIDYSFYLFFLLFFCIALAVFVLPPFDFDESLYQVVVKEMKQSGSLFHLTWDGRNMFEKPPLYYWCVLFVSYLIDGINGTVSTISCRLTSFLFFISTAILLIKTCDFKKNRYFPGVFLGLSFFPSIIGSAILFDPIVTFFFTLFVCSYYQVAISSQKGKNSYYAWISIAVFGACLAKGLIGIVIPVFFVFLYTLISSIFLKRINFSHISLKFVFSIFISLLISFLFYYFLYLKLGKEFFDEFFIKQHFQRALSAPMQGHKGFYFYYPLLFVFGSGLLFSVFLTYFNGLRSFVSDKRIVFLFSWILTVILFFSASSTKLPGYLLPAWPAFALATAILINDSKENLKNKFNFGFYFSTLMIVLMGSIFLLIAFTPLEYVLRIPMDQKSHEIILGIFENANPLRLGFGVIGLLFWTWGFYFTAFIKSKKTVSFANKYISISVFVHSIILLSIVFLIAPNIYNGFIAPYRDLTVLASELQAEEKNQNTCLDSFAAGTPGGSPTISLHYKGNRLHRCVEGDKIWYITPVWEESKCLEKNLHLIQRNRYLLLCGPE